MNEKGKRKRGEKKVYRVIPGVRNHWNRRRASDEAGQVLLITVLAVIVLLGSLALAADVGYWRYMRRNMQTAADAAAIAGATETIHNSSLVVSAARADASKNGFTDGEDNVIVTVNNPPASGPLSTPNGGLYTSRSDSSSYVEVIVTQPQPTFFAKIFGRTSQMVRARAVAYAGETAGDSCIIALNPDANRALRVEGAANVHADCNVCVSSDDPGALTVGGGSPSNPSELIAEGVSIAGGYDLNGANATLNPLPDPEDSAPYCGDPLAGINPPENWQTMPCEKTDYIAHDNTTLHPGRYCGGIKVLAGVEVPFEDGLYIIDGGYGLQNAAGSTLTGDHVTFYNTGGGPYGDGKITINGNSATDLEAGAPGYEGILFFQDPQNTQDAKFNGNSETTMLGALYFPTALVTFDGQNDTTVGYTMIVADTLKFTGGATYHIENDESGGASSTPPVTKVVLVE